MGAWDGRDLDRPLSVGCSCSSFKGGVKLKSLGLSPSSEGDNSLVALVEEDDPAHCVPCGVTSHNCLDRWASRHLTDSRLERQWMPGTADSPVPTSRKKQIYCLPSQIHMTPENPTNPGQRFADCDGQ